MFKEPPVVTALSGIIFPGFHFLLTCFPLPPFSHPPTVSMVNDLFARECNKRIASFRRFLLLGCIDAHANANNAHWRARFLNHLHFYEERYRQFWKRPTELAGIQKRYLSIAFSDVNIPSVELLFLRLREKIRFIVSSRAAGSLSLSIVVISCYHAYVRYFHYYAHVTWRRDTLV